MGLRKRIQRIEETASKQDKLTEEDFDLYLSCLPQGTADAIKANLSERIRQRESQKLFKDYKKWKVLFDVTPPDIVEVIKAKLKGRDARRFGNG